MRPSSTSSSRIAVAGTAALLALAAALSPASAGAAHLADSDAGVSADETTVMRETHRPRSADAAERWWLNCMAAAPHSADAAERLAEQCW